MSFNVLFVSYENIMLLTHKSPWLRTWNPPTFLLVALKPRSSASSPKAVSLYPYFSKPGHLLQASLRAEYPALTLKQWLIDLAIIVTIVITHSLIISLSAYKPSPYRFTREGSLSYIITEAACIWANFSTTLKQCSKSKPICLGNIWKPEVVKSSRTITAWGSFDASRHLEDNV